MNHAQHHLKILEIRESHSGPPTVKVPTRRLVILAARIDQFIQKWGGRVVLVTERQLFELGLPNPIGAECSPSPDPGVICYAPFSGFHGIDWARKILYIAFDGRAEKQRRTSELIGGAIHELGHLFATTKSPDHSEEWEFFGWEYAVARHLKLTWHWFRSSYDYSTTDRNAMFGKLRSKQKRALLQERLEAAMKLGTVSPQGEPLSVR